MLSCDFDSAPVFLYPGRQMAGENERVMQTSVLIVGGGLSGLYAALCLEEAGIDFQLVEARARFGGRILTVDAEGNPSADGFDLGPSWYWPAMHPRMARIVTDLGLRDIPQQSAGDVVLERSPYEMPQRFPGMRQEPPSMRLTGGTGSLVSVLLSRLPRQRLHSGSRVNRILKTPKGLEMRFSTAGEPRIASARQAILALPPRLLASTISFAPALDHDILRLWRQTATWMAPHAKFFALYDHAFWRDAGLSGTGQSAVGPLVEIHDATTASGAAALFGFIGLPHMQRAAIGEDALARACVAQLVRLFGDRAARPRATLLKDWAADGLTATEADQTAQGHPVPSPGPWITSGWAEAVSLAGSETSATDPGYLAGALEGGARAAGETLGRLKQQATTMPT